MTDCLPLLWEFITVEIIVVASTEDCTDVVVSGAALDSVVVGVSDSDSLVSLFSVGDAVVVCTTVLVDGLCVLVELLLLLLLDFELVLLELVLLELDSLFSRLSTSALT